MENARKARIEAISEKLSILKSYEQKVITVIN